MYVTLKYRDQTGRNTSKISPRLISVLFSVGTKASWIYSKRNTKRTSNSYTMRQYAGTSKAWLLKFGYS